MGGHDGGMGGPGGDRGGFPGGDFSGEGPGGTPPDGGMGELPGGDAPSDMAGNTGIEGTGDEMTVGTPDAGTTQATGSKTDSGNYSSYAEMVAAYEADIAEIEAGDTYGKNIVNLYNPLNYIGSEETENPTWMRIVCGATEGDISMMNSLNIQIKALDAGVDAVIEWQWDGGHVPSEILGNSLALYVDEMYGKYVEGAVTVTKPAAEKQTANGTGETASGTDLTSWATLNEDGKVSFSLADAAAYRTKGASKATPGFDVIDYGQEDYVFGDSDSNARHWSIWVLKALQENADVLEALFNQ